MHSGLSRHEIDRYVAQQEAKEGWQWYTDLDLRPWHSLITLWRANSRYRPERGMWIFFCNLVKAAVHVATSVFDLTFGHPIRRRLDWPAKSGVCQKQNNVAEPHVKICSHGQQR